MKKKNLKINLAPGDPIELVWRDATSNNSIWTPVKDAIEDSKNMKCDMNAIGYFVNKTSSYVTIAMVWDKQDGHYCGKILHIPTSELRTIKRIK